MGELARYRYPDLALAEAVELVRKIGELGGMVSQGGLAKMVGIDPRGAGLHSRISDLREFGLVDETKGGLKLTELAEEIVAGRVDRAWDAFMNISLYAAMHERLRGREPADKVVLHHILFEITKAPDEAISRRLSRLMSNYAEALPYYSAKTTGEATGTLTPFFTPGVPLSGSTVIPGIAPGSEMTDSNITLVDKGSKLYIVIEKDVQQLRLAKSFIDNIEASLKAKKTGQKSLEVPDNNQEA
jgi:hypothetical protein